MKIMSNLPPTDFQLKQANKLLETVGDALNLDDFDDTLQNDEAYALWDDIAVEEYERQGGKFLEDDPNEPADLRLFEDCQQYATDLIYKITS